MKTLKITAAITVLLFSVCLYSQAAAPAKSASSSISPYEFASLMNEMEYMIDSNKIRKLRNNYSAKYTCDQARQILSSVMLGSHRVEVLQIIASQIADTENKEILMMSFQNDIYSYKESARQIVNSIRPAEKNSTEPVIVKETVIIKEEKKEETPLKGRVNLRKSTSVCGRINEEGYHFDDDIKFEFSANREVGTTQLEIWISECKNSSDTSCHTPFMKKEKDILPDWKGLSSSHPVELKKLMSDNGRVKIPTKYEWYHFAVIIKDRVVAEKTFQIRNSCE
ncbi:MAG TPA: DUF4476 domain-containing protein [Leptospiraceae bacterium]|nr:DUF4476 domain-containing protein [Leptospiraceae bacterium]